MKLKKLLTICLIAIAAFTFSTVHKKQECQAAEVALITVGGIVATVAIGALGYAGYGSSFLTALSFDKEHLLRKETAEEAVQVYGSNNLDLIGPELEKAIVFIQNTVEEETGDEVTAEAALESIVKCYLLAQLNGEIQ
ncbi:MAG: hypothetical protein KAQ98_03250 [Bacteriovoracaceae bacterium]|nr:hypothetical protein [Bacteriovoracaceae bacterium]